MQPSALYWHVASTSALLDEMATTMLGTWWRVRPARMSRSTGGTSSARWRMRQGPGRRLYSYVVGFTIEEQAVEPRAGERYLRFDAAGRAARLDPASTPLTHAASRHMFDDAAVRFAFGVEVILDGLAARLGETPG